MAAGFPESRSTQLSDQERLYNKALLWTQMLGHLRTVFERRNGQEPGQSAEIARRLNVSPQTVAGVLDGRCQLTLDWVADILQAMDAKLETSVVYLDATPAAPSQLSGVAQRWSEVLCRIDELLCIADPAGFRERVAILEAYNQSPGGRMTSGKLRRDPVGEYLPGVIPSD